VADGSGREATRELGFILRGTTEVVKNDALLVSAAIEYTDLLGWLPMREGETPVFESFATDLHFLSAGRSYHLLRATRGGKAVPPGLKPADSLGARLMDQPVDAFLLVSVERQNVGESRSCAYRHSAAACTFLSVGRKARKAIRDATRAGSILSHARYTALQETLSKLDDVEVLASMPTFLASVFEEPSVKWVCQVTYDTVDRLATREYGQIIRLLPEGDSLTSSAQLVYPSTIDGTVRYSSPAVLASNRNEKLSPGETSISPIAPPPGVLAPGHTCYAIMTVRDLER
jgi:hypothetical protein